MVPALLGDFYFDQDASSRAAGGDAETSTVSRGTRFLEDNAWTDPDIIDMGAELGEAFVRGRNAMQNFELGLPLLRRAAELNNARAMLALSAAYDQGLGVEKNEDVGFEWLRRAADAGSMNARTVGSPALRPAQR